MSARTRKVLACAVSVFSCCIAAAPSLEAAIVPTGNVTPEMPWDGSTDGYVGKDSDGSLTVDEGSTLSSNSAYLGFGDGVTGGVSITGAGSAWSNSHSVYVGYSGSGALSITNGATLSNINNYSTFIGYNAGSTGRIIVDGIGSKNTGASAINVGYGGSGSMTISAGAEVSDTKGCVGYDPGSAGIVTVDGTASTWTSNIDLWIGRAGKGTLNIDGGTVMVKGATTVAANEGSTGAINFGPSGGVLTTGSLVASPTQLTGSGTINARGLVTDTNVVFDSAPSLRQTILLNDQSGKVVTLNLDLSATSTDRRLGAGYFDNGSISIRNAVTVKSQYLYLGYHNGSTGAATVEGVGSKWTNAGLAYVGYYGNGTLSIASGATASNDSGVPYYMSSGTFIGYGAGSTGVLAVDGAGSKWSNYGALYVGNSGSGTILVSGGGSVALDTSQICYLGYVSGSAGMASVSGVGSALSAILYVGDRGQGTVNITGGGWSIVPAAASAPGRAQPGQ